MSSGGGDGGAGARQEEEERRKADLRARIDRLYGINSVGPTFDMVDEQVMVSPGGQGEGESSTPTYRTIRVQRPRDTSALSAEAEAARRAMEGESTKLAEATRGYYTDQLGEKYQDAERQTRFRLARQGLMGGSEDIYQQGEVKEDRDLGATRVDEAVRRAVANLTSQREQERLNAINLVNAGAGDSAVSAAQAGLRNSFENVSSQQKADIFSDLFANAADGLTAANLADQQAALVARYRDRLSSFFPSRGSASGRVTPSA